MSLDPIKLFSQCQASFIQKSNLESKIYALTCSVLAGGTAYLLSSINAFPLRRIESQKTALGVSVLTWLFLTTFVGYFLRNKRNDEA